ncbi:DUF1553 domain-containing protein [bacterium]|nr:DUF1553 domain-containing protein [bacterium]
MRLSNFLCVKIISLVLMAGGLGFITPEKELIAAEPKPPTQQELAFFETKIRPLLATHCIECHGEETQENSLRLDTLAGILGGGSSGASVIPRDTKHSLLLAAVRHDNEQLKMPPDEKLSDAEIQFLEQWIEKGAPHPDQLGNHDIKPRRSAIDWKTARNHWAFKPIRRPQVPDSTSDQSPIDAFIDSARKSQGLVPNQPADKRTLIRRATFDLIGLPPTPEEIEAFLADESPTAFEKVIDRLLASKHYGERWGRHWLDVVRYADSNGQDENQVFVDAWRYRNYVIDSFNQDKPFDRFVIEQIAGDLISDDPKSEWTQRDYDPIVATGFLELGPKVLAEKDTNKLEMDIIDEQISSFGEAFLGLTIACARCHDHKFDPISTADYYALAGIFKSTQSMQALAPAKYNEQILASAEGIERKAKLDELKKAKQAEIDTLVKSANEQLKNADGKLPSDAENHYPEETRQQLTQLRQEVADLTTKAPELPTAMAVQDGKATNVRIHVRGSHLILGEQVNRGIPTVLQDGDPLVIGDAESGRLQMAQWLVSPTNPLTARVAVNRVWRWHFGTGLVASPNNFGKLGASPTHPELLDWLAAEFMANGWSLKKLHRQIMLSDTYRLSSATSQANQAFDPENRWYWKTSVQRLDAESLRDSILYVSGQLDETPGESMLTLEKWKLVFDHTSKDTTNYDSHRRSVYLPVIRNNLYDVFSLFDYATADTPLGNRQTSTVAPQALFTMNSDLFLNSAEALARRVSQDEPNDQEARVQRAYELTLGRPPEASETARFLDTVAQFKTALKSRLPEDQATTGAWTAACQCLLGSNEFTYVR